jgi:hypothetical protein
LQKHCNQMYSKRSKHPNTSVDHGSARIPQ